MDSPILKQIANFLQKRKKHKHWLVIFTCMAVLVGLGTVTALKLMGQAMTRKEKVLNCGLEVHAHTDECHDEAGNLICGLADYVVHAHNDDCYDTEGNLVCKLPEVLAHTHTEECYTDQEVLVCGQEEAEGHVHEEACYTKTFAGIQCQTPEHQHGTGCFDEAGNLVCEAPEHQHANECYDEAGNLVCTQASHTHMVSCFDQDNNLTCAAAEHLHAPECLAMEDTLVCGLEEGADGHAHADACFEIQQVLACGQLELHTHTEACFAEVKPEDGGEATQTLVCTLPILEEHIHSEELGCFVIVEAPAVDEVPETVNGTEAAQSTEAAEGTEAVAENGTEAAAENDTEAVEETETNTEEFVKIFEDDNYIVTATYTAKAEIPEEAELVVKPITAEGDEANYTEQEAKYQEAVGDENAVMSALLEIGFFVDGEEIQPKDTVTMTVQLLDENGLPEGVPVSIVHFAEDGVEVLDGSKAEDGSTTFQTGSFSPYGIGYTEEDLSKAGGASQKASYNLPLAKDVVETKKFIDINLYDYGQNINDLYYRDFKGTFNDKHFDSYASSNPKKMTDWESAKYPVFQQDNGTILDINIEGKWGTSFNYGDNVVFDIDAKGGREITGTNNAGNINSIFNGANSALSGLNGSQSAMSMQLKDGFPQLADGTSLDYLFQTSEYASKKNGSSLDYLFRYNAKTGAYDFDSRVNHAEYDDQENRFKVYDALLTPNFIMYPFGNFMPFNQINSETKQASDITRADFKRMKSSAAAKQKEDAHGLGEEYGTLSTKLGEFDAAMSAPNVFGENWTAQDAVNKYFTSTTGLQGKTNWTNEDLKNLYSIDYDIPKNFFFGMDMEMDFLQPKNGMTGVDNKYPMRFEFAGDDDVWVYVDGVMFLNLSGIHRHIAGSIDFKEGKVYYYSYDSYTSDQPVETVDGTTKVIRATTKKDVGGTPEYSETFYDILIRAYGNEKGNEKAAELLINVGTKEAPRYTTFKNYSTHNFKFYYTERGAGSSVCRINFNFPLLPKNSISVYKELQMDEDHPGALGNPDFEFQVLKANGNEYTEGLFIGANTTYKIFKDGKDTGKTGTTNAEGVFTLKAGEMAVFEDLGADQGAYYVRELLDASIFEQYGGTIEVDGQITSQTEEGIEIGSDKFVGILSPIKQIDDGDVTAFTITNKVKFEKLGALEISKVVPPSEQEALPPGKTFEFNVTLDGEPLKVGTPYAVYQGQNQIRGETVSKEGIIVLKAGETVKIQNILSGVEYTIQETKESSNGYIVIYEEITDNGSNSVVITDNPDSEENVDADVSGDAGSAEETLISGTISLNTAVKIRVTNTTGAASVEIPGTKTLENPDGKEHTYNFTLTRVKDQNGTPYGEADEKPHQETISAMESQVELKEGEKGFTFFIPYQSSQIEKDKLDENGTVKFYYEIAEKIPDAADQPTKYDESRFVVEVTVTRDSVGRLTAEVTKTYQDGQEVADSAISFTNELLTDLTVIKIADRAEDQTVKFDFNIEINSPKELETSYPTTEGRQNQEEKEGTISLTKGEGNIYTTNITLKPGEYVIIKGLPYGITWKVTETNTDGYAVYHVVETKAYGDIPLIAAKTGNHTEINKLVSSESTVNAEVANGEATDNTVTFINVAKYKLPETGGVGTTPYTMAGVMALLGAGLLYRRKFRERRV